MEFSPAFLVYAGSVIVLGMNLLVLANNTALSRAKNKEVVNPEDVVLNEGAKVVYEGGNDLTERYRRAHRNALENIPFFMITCFVLVTLGASMPVVAGLCGVFVLARVSHSICYLKGIQPFRTASFGIGALVQLVLLGFIGYYAFIG